MQLKLILLIYSCYTLAPAFDNNGTCYDRDSKPYCCDFYEQTNSGCVECKDGFESTRGSDCIPCSNNTYGKRCVFQCICMNYQRCHHISGCVDFTTTEDVYQGYSTVLRSVTEKENSNDKSRRDTEFKSILIYIVAAGLVTFVFTTTVIMISRKRKRIQYAENIRIQREDRIAYLQNENEQNEQYSTIL